MKRHRLTIISLLCTLVAAANDAGPGIGSRFSGGRLKVGPKGAVVLLHGSRTQLNELQEGYEASRKLGLLATAAAGPGLGWIVLDAKSIVVAHYDPSYTFAAILVHQFGWGPAEPAVEVEGKQLTARAGESNAAVAPGQRVALILDIDLQPNMHVYAPGVEGYIPIDWKMQDAPAAAVHPAVFPRSQKLYLKAIAETVPAYRGHFRLIRDVTIVPQDQLRPVLDSSGRFTVPGSLRYQACDDRVCYIPQELRLNWTFRLVLLQGQN
jgi:hypothetical protein